LRSPLYDDDVTPALLCRAAAGVRLMPRIPIIPPPEYRDGGDGTGGGADALAPEQAAALRALEARTARIDRELAFSQSWLASVERLGEAEDAPEGPPPGFTRSFLEQADRERADLLKTLPPGRRSDLEQDLLDLRGELAGRAADVEASGLALRRRFGLHRSLEGYRTGVARDPGLYDRAAARMEALVADLGLPDDRREPMHLHVKDALGNAAVDGLMGAPERAARVLSAGLYDDALTEASKAARLKEAEGLAARNRLLARERTLSELMARADEGAASEDAIGVAEGDGRLTAVEANQLRQRNAASAQAAAFREARI